MGADYYIYGHVPAKPSVGSDQLDKMAIVFREYCDEVIIDTAIFDDKHCVVFNVGGSMSYGSVVAVDAALADLFKTLGDFTAGIACYTYTYEDDEQVAMFYGPETMCLEAYIASARQRIKEAEGQIGWAERRLKKSKRKKVSLVDNFVPDKQPEHTPR